MRRLLPLLTAIGCAGCAGCGPPRLPSLQLFVENRLNTAVAVPAGEPLQRTGTRTVTAGVRLGFVLERREPPP
jgi:hypothetical protein